MNKDHLIGALVMVSIICFMGASSQIYNRFDNESAIGGEFANVYKVMQTKNFRIQVTTPSAADIGEGELVIVSTNSINLITKVRGTVTPLTKN